VASGTLGLLALRLTRTTSDFYVASRSVGPLLNASAISGEYLSAASFMGVAGMVMKFGADVLWYPVGYATGYLFLLLFIAAPLRRFGAYTVPDYAEGRFNSAGFRKIAVIFVMLIGFFYMLPQMKGAGVTLQAVLHVPYFVGVVAGALAHDIYGKTLRPTANSRQRRRAFQISAVLGGTAAVLAGLIIDKFDINMLVGWAFAIAASSFFPLLVLGTWWRGLTKIGATSGVIVGGASASLAIIVTMLLGETGAAFGSGGIVKGVDPL